ncbi:MAG TPA: cellulose-binding protein, partial [Ktedonobacteraceae bacterium]|nr:cellulose-binding protein [Ktedonobacteraceae bacterium]
ACSSIDFASVHWYPQGPTGESDSALLASPANGESTSVSFTPSIPSMVSTLNSKVSQYCGNHARSIKTMITETNSVSFNPGKQTTNLVNALFLAENYMTWLSNGVMNVDWWDVHNSIVTWGNLDPSLYGSNNFGDYGLFSVGDPGEPAAETPMPSYYGLQIVSKIVGPFGQIVAASSDQSLVHAFAVRQRNGSIAILLINTDPTVSYRVRLAGINCGGFGHSTVYTYGQNSTSVSVSVKHGHDVSSQVIAPYSLTAIVLR